MEAELASRSERSDDHDDLKTAISNAKTAAQFGVRKSQLEFYEAFSNADLDAMSKLRSNTSHVQCVHPGMEAIEGRDEVMEL